MTELELLKEIIIQLRVTNVSLILILLTLLASHLKN